MPIYEYECQGCGETFEVMQKVSDPAPESHSCGATEVRRVLSQTSFVLKGTGWYLTDYARKDGNNGSSNGGGKKRDNSDSASAKESKSEAKASSSDSGNSTTKSGDSAS